MTKRELGRRLRHLGYDLTDGTLSRLTAQALDQPQRGRPIGHPGHRDYSELDYRRVAAWLRVHALCGDDGEPTGQTLRRTAAWELAHRQHGYVWIADGTVGWSPLPPVHLVRNGVATCWAVVG